MIDKMAAVIILQGILSMQSTGRADVIPQARNPATLRKEACLNHPRRMFAPFILVNLQLRHRDGISQRTDQHRQTDRRNRPGSDLDHLLTFDYEGRRIIALMPMEEAEGIGEGEVLLLCIEQDEMARMFMFRSTTRSS